MVQRKRLLSPSVERLARLYLADGLTRTQTAVKLRIKLSWLVARLADQLRDARVGQGRRETRLANGDRQIDPTEAEIAARSAEVRGTWDLATECSRRCGRNDNFTGD